MICSAENCLREVPERGAKQLCMRHYYRLRRYGDPLGGGKYLERDKEPKGPCAAEDCSKQATHKQFCAGHYYRWKKNGTWRELQRGRPSKRSYGKGHIAPSGYAWIFKPEHPNCTKHGYIAEHRYVMSEYLKRPLSIHEIVHHRNGVRDDNCINNLELWTKSHPEGQRVEDKVAWALELIRLYPEYVKKAAQISSSNA